MDETGMKYDTLPTSYENTISPNQEDPHYRRNPIGAPQSQLSEFTRRKNWSQRIMEELRDLAYVVGPTGVFIYVSPSSVDLTGYYPADIIGHNITEFIHIDDIDVFVRTFNLSIQVKERFSLFYRLRRKDDSYVVLETNGHPHFEETENSLLDKSSPQLCKCFFMSARPYPSRSTSALDSFLELKIENERLKKKLRELNDYEDKIMQPQTSLRISQGSENMPPPNLPIRSPHASSRDSQNLPSQGPPSMFYGDNNHSNVDSSSHRIDMTMVSPNRKGHALEQIELMTGLRFRDGERAQGISTGSESPMLLSLDGKLVSTAAAAQENVLHPSSSPYPIDNDSDRPRKKNKKLKLAPDEYVCTDCGTTDSPEWRKGPMGAKTLCNACGLRYAKKSKQKPASNSDPVKDHASL